MYSIKQDSSYAISFLKDKLNGGGVEPVKE